METLLDKEVGVAPIKTLRVSAKGQGRARGKALQRPRRRENRKTAPVKDALSNVSNFARR
ncbi:MAG: hypothetical protein JSW48_17095 [Betaproteobacteria bacterium]|nr:MAG: hypothetical protein JSW48_17095 [Betaproteobacteria bacterium]